MTATTVDDLVSIADIADLLGVKRETTDLWRVRDRRGRVAVLPMPKPVVPHATCRSSCPLWDRNEVIEWAKATNRWPADKLARSLL